MLIILGSTGFGLVWGWLIAGVFSSGRKSVQNILLLSVATALLLTEVLWLAGWRSAAFFSAAAVIAFLIYRGWRRLLHNRFRVNETL